MIRFIKLNTQNKKATFFDGSKPFIHWSDPVSTGMLTYMRINWVSDSSSHNLEIEDGGPFSFYELGNDWICSSNVKWKLLLDPIYKTKISGTKIQDKEYWYDLIIILNSDVEGEFIATFKIDNEEYNIGAQFWGEDETLSINLGNQGLDISNLIYKALYSADLHNNNPDFVLLNRKFKELLMNYLDIHGNKGSYTSLINSLKWFEYDNLVNLREIWRYYTPDGTKYYDKSLSKYLTDEIKSRVFNSSKTTSFYLRHQIKQLKPTTREFISTEYEYDEDIYGRKFDEMCTKWSLDEMRLKMVMLGGFFEQYFMSIHNELIRSVCEDIFLTDDITLEYDTKDVLVDNCSSNMEVFTSSWSSDQEDDNDKNTDDTGNKNGGDGLVDTLSLYLDEVHVFAGLPMTDPNGQLFENTVPQESIEIYSGLPYIPITACHTMDEENQTISSNNELKYLYGQYFNGIGAVAKCCFEFPENITNGYFSTNTHNEDINITQNINPSEKINLKFLFQRPGDFNMTFRFNGQSGAQYQKIVKVNVKNNIEFDMEFKQMVARVKPMEEQINPWSCTQTPARYMFARTKELKYNTIPVQGGYQVEYVGEYNQSQYIPARPHNPKNQKQKEINQKYQDAPYLSQMINIQWDNDIYLQKAIDYYKNEYYRYGSGEKIWFQVIPKKRGGNLNIPDADFVNNGTVWTSEVFIPELHDLKDIKGNINQYYPIVCTPVIYIENNGIKKVPYSYYVDAQLTGQPVWEFYSYSKARNINELKDNTQEPIMSWKYKESLPSGYYRIKYRVNWDKNDTKGIECVKETNFKLIQC